MTKLLAELHANDLIRLYQHDGKTYLQITRWKERIRSTQSKFPAPPGVQNEHSANGTGWGDRYVMLEPRASVFSCR